MDAKEINAIEKRVKGGEMDISLLNSKLLNLLKINAYAAYISSLIGGGPEIIGERFKFFKEIEPGNLVMEISTIWRDQNDNTRFGYLISNQQEFSHSDEEWKEIKTEWKGSPRPMEQIWRIKLLTTGEEFSWSNADFIRIPDIKGLFK